MVLHSVQLGLLSCRPQTNPDKVFIFTVGIVFFSVPEEKFYYLQSYISTGISQFLKQQKLC